MPLPLPADATAIANVYRLLRQLGRSIRWGSGNVTVASGSSAATTSIDYGAPDFLAPPAVFLTPRNGDFNLSVQGSGGTGNATIRATRLAGTGTVTVPFFWFAIGDVAP